MMRNLYGTDMRGALGASVLGLSLLAVGGLFGCASDNSGDLAGTTEGYSGDVSRSAESMGATSGNGTVSAGTLTAGVWDDNRNYSHYSDFRTDNAGLTGLPDFSDDEHLAANEGTVLAAHVTLDIALVIDATGSMGDEMEYLKEEFRAISETIEADYPNGEQRWALIVYRDEGDEYVTRVFDFTSDLDAFRGDLLAQVASGGGDYPEASHAALRDMNELTWRTDAASARLAFWIADAPHHASVTDVLADAIRDAQSADVAIYPVASSGVDTLTEASMRAAAQLTGGRYIFLTDDSGVGGSHLEPTIPCYFVTKLDDAILRMVDIEMSGVYREPSSTEVLRSAGDPAEGKCRLEDVDYAVF